MSEVPEDLKYTEDHEWVRLDGNVARIGITDHAQDALTDVVYVELPDEGEEFTAGDSMGVVESTKSVNDIFAPVAGRVVEVNPNLEDNPELVNEQPYGEGWMVAMDVADAGEVEKLMDAASYRAFVGE